MEDGVRLVELARVKQLVHRHFERLFAEDWCSRPKLLGLFATINSVVQVECFEAEFSKHEIWVALQDCDGNKAPRSDGFNLACIQKC